MTSFYARHNIGDIVAYRLHTPDSLTPAAVATVTGISYELAPHQGRVTYRLSSGVTVDDSAVLNHREAMQAGLLELHDLFEIMDTVGKRISAMNEVK